MIKKIKNLLFIALATMALAAPMAVPVASYAAISDKLCQGSTAASGEDCSGTGAANVDTKLQDIITTITTWFTIIIGGLSVIMIIFGGFRYITSGGDSGKVGNAKNTIIYAIIGLLIVVLAQVIINVVLKVGKTETTGL